jgi:hypothetical protein
VALTPKDRRARRRARSLTVSKRRRAEHVHTRGPDRPLGFFAKRTAYECGCRKRQKGRPKVAAGMCCIGERDRIYDWRHEARDLRVAVLVGRYEDEEAETEATTTSPNLAGPTSSACATPPDR